MATIMISSVNLSTRCSVIESVYCVQCRGAFFRSKEERKEARQQIYKEIAEGYFSDFHEFRKNKGKRSIAPTHLNTKKEAISFPTMKCYSLLKQTVTLPNVLCGNVSLVLLSMRAMGMKMCDEYRKEVEKTSFGNGKINVVEQLVYRAIRAFLEKNLRNQIETYRHERFLSFYGKFSGLKKHLEIHNSIIGYAYLLDSDGKIRWRSHGVPDEKELYSLIKCSKELLAKKGTKILQQ